MSDAATTARTPVTALVTGGGGFIGRAVAERLVARGDTVRSLSRRHYLELDVLGVKQVTGDIADADAVNQACKGCDVVFHVAAKAGVWGAYDDYHLPNVVGTENVLAACRRFGVSRLVYTSSPSVVFDGGEQEGVDESVPYPRVFRSHYSATKARAEKDVLGANSEVLKTLALRPHLVWGPGDNHIVPRIIAQGRAGKLRIIGAGDNKVDTTYIDNAADAHIRAADALDTNAAAAGRAYFISNGEPMVVWEVINGILASADLPPVTRRVPRGVAVAAGVVLETVYRALRLRSEPRMTRFVAEELASAHWFDISAARSVLGYEPRVSIAEGMGRLKVWLKSQEA